MVSRSLTISRRPAEPSDDGLVRTLFEQSRPEFALLPPEVAGPLLDLQVRAQHLHYATHYPNAGHEILVADGVDVGRLITDDSVDAVQIVDVAVLEAYRGRGIGSAVLGEVIAGAARSSRGTRLSVWHENVAARRLYERLGFVAVTDDAYIEMFCTAVEED